MSKNIYILTEGGQLQRWNLQGNINITESVMNHLTKSHVRKLRAPFTMKDIDPIQNRDAVWMAIAGNMRTLTMPLKAMQLTTPYEEIEGVFTPAFASAGPPMPIIWVPPASMFLTLTVVINDGFEPTEQHLIAFDNEWRSYRLPLSNLHDDAKLCAGRQMGHMYSDSILQCGQMVMDQFRNSQWQQDLYNTGPENVKNTRAMFRFTPSDKGFTQQEVPANWPKHCGKIGTQFITNFVIP